VSVQQTRVYCQKKNALVEKLTVNAKTTLIAMETQNAVERDAQTNVSCLLKVRHFLRF